MAVGLLKEEEISQDVWPYIEAAVALHRRYMDAEDIEEDSM